MLLGDYIECEPVQIVVKSSLFLFPFYVMVKQYGKLWNIGFILMRITCSPVNSKVGDKKKLKKPNTNPFLFFSSHVTFWSPI